MRKLQVNLRVFECILHLCLKVSEIFSLIKFKYFILLFRKFRNFEFEYIRNFGKYICNHLNFRWKLHLLELMNLSAK